MAVATTHDSSWLRSAFMVPADSTDDDIDYVRFFNTGRFKFTDTTLGGNFEVNPGIQGCRYGDINEDRQYPSIGKGMGRAYSQNIDDTACRVHFQAGVTSFNELSNFFTTFYSTMTSDMIRTGRVDQVLFSIAKFASYLITVPIHVTMLALRAVDYVTGGNPTSFCYLKPTMPLYWNAVSNMINRMSGYLGTSLTFTEDEYTTGATTLSQEDIANYNMLLPDIFRSNGQLDPYMIANRAQRLADVQEQMALQVFENTADWKDVREGIKAAYKSPLQDTTNPSLNSILEKYVAVSSNQPIEGGSNQVTTNSDGEKEYANPIAESTQEMLNDPSFFDLAKTEMREGSNFVTFKVDYNGAVGESVSTSVVESTLSRTINGMSQNVRSTRYNIAEGNIGGLFTPIQMFMESTMAVLKGAAAGAGLSGLFALAGSGFVDIPKMVGESQASLPTESYTMKLRSPYGDKMSLLMNLYWPLACILALALPRSTGPASYNAPFNCAFFSKGRMQTRFGVVTSLSIQRGVGNTGFNRDGYPLGIDVTFQVTDLSSIMHMPITAGMTPTDIFDTNSWNEYIFGGETAYSDYLATITAVGFKDQLYVSSRLKRNFRQGLLDLRTWFTPSHFASYLFGSFPVGVTLQSLANFTDRP